MQSRNIKQLIRHIPGKAFPLNLAAAFARHSQPQYIENARRVLESISPKPRNCCRNISKPLVSGDVDLSIILPVYNVENYISECIDSIISQETSYSFEIILVNDGSTDSSREKAITSADGDGRLVVVDQPNRGLAAARNCGLDHCHGAAVTFIDSDDYVKQGFIQKYMDALSLENVDYIDGGYSDIDDSGKQFDTCYSRKNMGTVWGRVFKRKVWADVRFPEGCLFEDTILPYLIYPRYSSTIIHDDSYCYRHRKGSISRSGKNPRVLDSYWVVEILLDECARLGIPFQAVATDFLVNACYMIYKRRLQFEAAWLLPVFSAFVDLWTSRVDMNSLSALPSKYREIGESLSERKFNQWRFLAMRNLMEEL